MIRVFQWRGGAGLRRRSFHIPTARDSVRGSKPVAGKANLPTMIRWDILMVNQYWHME